MRDKVKMPIDDEIIAEDGLALKALTLKHASAFFKLAFNNREHFAQFQFSAPEFNSLFEARQAIETLAEMKAASECAAFGLWQDNQLRGYFSINSINWVRKQADIGFWLDQAAQGQGLALKGVKALTYYCFESLKCDLVTAHTALTNERCQRLLIKSGFTKTSTARAHIETGGKYIDALRFEIRIS